MGFIEDTVRQNAEELAAGLTDVERRAFQTAFRISSEHEMKFWEMSDRDE